MPTYASFAPPPHRIPQHSAPLIGTTPPTIAAALVQIYPFVATTDYILSLVTWTCDDPWASFLLLAVYLVTVEYLEILVRYLSQLLLVLAVVGLYKYLTRPVGAEQPSLEEIVHKMSSLAVRLKFMVSPLASLPLSNHNATRIVLTSLLTAPLYAAIGAMLSARRIAQIVGIFLLSYHSLWARVSRAVLWQWKPVRTFMFYWTGIDFDHNAREAELKDAIFRSTSTDLQDDSRESDKSTSDSSLTGASGKSLPERTVKLTYVLFENQRHWLGQGWTSNMLAYERAPWTDEFLNETQSTETFTLPKADGTGLRWRWVDPSWGVDLTNNGLLSVSEESSSICASPGADEGFVYYDNLWRKPSSEVTYSKYTRRRRWLRTAELVPEQAVDPTPESRGSKWAEEWSQSASTTSTTSTTNTSGGTGVQLPSGQMRKRNV